MHIEFIDDVFILTPFREWGPHRIQAAVGPISLVRTQGHRERLAAVIKDILNSDSLDSSDDREKFIKIRALEKKDLIEKHLPAFYTDKLTKYDKATKCFAVRAKIPGFVDLCPMTTHKGGQKVPRDKGLNLTINENASDDEWKSAIQTAIDRCVFE